jgi:hypothetical protein
MSGLDYRVGVGKKDYRTKSVKIDVSLTARLEAL